jgi:protein tyrosine phosphatase
MEEWMSNEYIDLEKGSGTQVLGLNEIRRMHPTGTKPQHYYKNRYSDVLPEENSRIVLNNSSDYINANLVNIDQQTFISTQAPLPVTFTDFWNMIWEYNCPVIVALIKLVENGRVKGEKYWPTCKHPTMIFGYIKVSIQKFIDLKDIDTEFRLLTLEHCQTGIKKIVCHIHYKGWPDFGVPTNSSSLRQLVSLVRQLSNVMGKIGVTGPPTVHCSAGIGRTGTFLAIYILLNSPIFVSSNSEEFRNKIKLDNELRATASPLNSIDWKSFMLEFSVFNLVVSLRKQRNRGMVQTKEQYHLIYKTILDELIAPTTNCFSNIINSVQNPTFEGLCEGVPVKK